MAFDVPFTHSHSCLSIYHPYPLRNRVTFVIVSPFALRYCPRYAPRMYWEESAELVSFNGSWIEADAAADFCVCCCAERLIAISNVTNINIVFKKFLIILLL